MQVKAIEVLEPAALPVNHFRHDSFHMGASITEDLLVMFGEFERNPYVILCDNITGERTRIWLDLEPIDPVKGHWHMGRFYPEHWSYTEESVPVVKHNY